MFKVKDKKATENSHVEFDALNLDRASLLRIPGVAQDRISKAQFAPLFMDSPYDKDSFSTPLVFLDVEVPRETARLRIPHILQKTQQLFTVLEAHTIVIHTLKKF
jgi:hypothetical protein